MQPPNTQGRFLAVVLVFVAFVALCGLNRPRARQSFRSEFGFYDLKL